MKKFSKVFLITFPFLHQEERFFVQSEKKNLAEQYRFVIEQLAKDKDMLVVCVHPRSDYAPRIAFLRFARKRLGSRFLYLPISEKEGLKIAAGHMKKPPSCFEQLIPPLQRNREIILSGCGELMQVCSNDLLQLMEKSLKSNGFKATYSSHSLIASVKGKRTRDVPFYNKKQFQELKKRKGTGFYPRGIKRRKPRIM